ncbi:hypothetical protein CN373_00485 [Bacillus cereus]|uniref:DUF3986 family protein n=1 Tax=Bacillus cereus TaxID=1396 RepID=UPI000BFA850B|nr:DUF3986 family protein [Bacillus cereus]PFA25680.1 hypothetical protein CN373_00485 [Bacillus cereus]
MSSLYDPRYHLHLGYYENKYDFEAIAYKQKENNIWDIFFDFKMYMLALPAEYSKQSYENHGVHIFSIRTEDLDYNLGTSEFTKWLIQQKIVN